MRHPQTQCSPPPRRTAAPCGIHPRRTLLCTLLLGFLMLPAAAQQRAATPADAPHARVHVLARSSADSIVLRWAPDAAHAWRLGNRIGWRVERSSSTGERVVLTPEPLLAVNPETIDARLQNHEQNRFLMIAMIAAWGDSTLAGEPDSLGLDTLDANRDRNTQLYGYGLFAADNDPDVATLLGLRLVDRPVQTGVTYTYTVSLAEERDYRIAPGEVTITAGNAPPALPPPRELKAEGLDGRIDLRWLAPAGPAYTGWHVLRSDDGGRSFTSLTDVPRVMLATDSMPVEPHGAYIDTTIVNGRTYVYRVVGVDAFAMRGAHADVEAKGVDRTPPPAPIVRNPEQLGLERIRLTWDMEYLPKDLAGFHILRSAASDTGYVRITRTPLAADARSFEDARPDDAEPFYKVAALDAAGNESRSLPLYGLIIDTTRPEPPRNLTGSIDTAGVVRLHWNPVRGRNVLGYRVLRANSAEHEYAQMTGEVLRDTSFTDTVEVRTLTRSVYYMLATVSRTYRSSLTTAPLELKRPDLVPPSAPVFTTVRVDEGIVRLAWAPSSSDDVAAQLLLRSSETDTTWREIARLAPAEERWIDSTGVPGIAYFYHLEAVDETGLRARTDVPVHARPFDSGVRPAVESLRAEYDSAASAITVSWSYAPRNGEAHHFVIYREAGGYDLSAVATVPGGETRYVDTSLRADGPYLYRVKVQASGGAESPLSPPVWIILQR